MHRGRLHAIPAVATQRCSLFIALGAPNIIVGLVSWSEAVPVDYRGTLPVEVSAVQQCEIFVPAIRAFGGAISAPSRSGTLPLEEAGSGIADSGAGVATSTIVRRAS